MLKLKRAFKTIEHLCLALEYCPEGDLYSLMYKENKKLSKMEIVRYSANILLALEHLHEMGIVFRE
jgi:serine/threonine protein kinase